MDCSVEKMSISASSALSAFYSFLRVWNPEAGWRAYPRVPRHPRSFFIRVIRVIRGSLLFLVAVEGRAKLLESFVAYISSSS